MTQTLILKAAHFAAQKHRDQRRKDDNASPYINHPIAVALLLTEVGEIEDPEVIAAALLHDTIEDTATTAEELTLHFGSRVCGYVEEVSDDKTLYRDERKRQQIDHAPELSEQATLIKLADKICNITDIAHAPPSGWNRQRRMEYLDWAEAVINNCRKVNEALEHRFREQLKAARSLFQNS